MTRKDGNPQQGHYDSEINVSVNLMLMVEFWIVDRLG
jgi:hypothetical protein